MSAHLGATLITSAVVAMATDAGTYPADTRHSLDYGVSYADAHFGDFHGFGVPRTYVQKVWLCTEVAVRVHRHWRFNGAPGTPGVRGCAYVQP